MKINCSKIGKNKYWGKDKNGLQMAIVNLYSKSFLEKKS